MMEKVAVTTFVKRQIKGSGKTYSESLSFDDIAEDAEVQMNRGKFEEGYRDGVRIVTGSLSFTSQFTCPFVKIDENTELISSVMQRQEGEDPYIQTRAKNGTLLKAGRVEYILYRHDVLAENDEQSTEAEWELISIHAIPEGIDKLPMGPVTMMRNQLELKGGTKAHYTSEEWAEAVRFWQKYAALDGG
ncbi:MAG: DUF3228 family protein [Candidatus Marinimicrobia bacterium]|nr:DUF3228 family protein [Candidatus Neomarinimicrobiota bacterium]